MNGFKFFELDVYQEAKLFKVSTLPLTQRLKNSREFGLCDQLSRATISVMLNIAEGSIRRSSNERIRYLEIALGSLNESVACIDIALEISMINKKDFELYVANASKLAKMLMSFMTHLKKI